MKPLIEMFGGSRKTGKEKVISDYLFFVKKWTKDNVVLSGLELTSLPVELFSLSRIRSLDLSNNKLSQIPADFKNLKRLEVLNLSNNQFSDFPSFSSLPQSLRKLVIRGNRLKSINLHNESTLTYLVHLDLEDNEIIHFYYSDSTVGGLRELNLRGNKIENLSIENGSSLESLILSRNNIKKLTTQFSPLSSLKHIFLDHNSLADIPHFVFEAPHLEVLNLASNKISSLSPRLTSLISLKSLTLSENEISDLPVNLFQLSHLKELQISKNKIKHLPTEICRSPELSVIEVFENPIETPPKAVVEQGSSAILLFLREIDAQNIEGNDHRLWTSKLMVVGEGGVGKTSLVKALKGESYNSSEDTTHGIRIETIELPHPNDSSIEMRLNTWDFGGQQIYHATHQFFLTDNSIFLFVWNARTEFNQGRPYYWLDMITANAPKAPIILIATHLDQRREQIPLDYLREKYPQISSLFFEVSNLDRRGIDSLRDHIQELASRLPLMGKPWPVKWEEVTVALRQNPKKVINRKEFIRIFEEYNLDQSTAEILARYLHDLGEILQYPDSPALKDLVILEPQWISEHISKVLTADSVLDSGGILTQQEISEQWRDVSESTQELFLELMEQYDLAYRIPKDPINRAIVVEQLHPDRPEQYAVWRQLLDRQDLRKVEIEYRLSSMQPGLPTWFIARTHRFSLGIHWRRGSIFADSKEKRNYALVEAFDQEKLIRLTVIGSSPYNFMSILKDGLELTFKRYPGMKVNSFVPCPGDSEDFSCEGSFSHLKLKEALDRGLSSLQCQSCFSQIQINLLLFGIGGSTTDLFNRLGEKVMTINELLPEDNLRPQGNYENFDSQVFLIHQMHRIVHEALSKQAEAQSIELREIRRILEGFSDNFELLHRRFIAQFNALQAIGESQCPSTFLFKVGENPKDLFRDSPLELHLLCQYPKHLHPATFPIQGGQRYSPYIIDRPKEWIVATVPFIRAMLQVMAFAPLIPNSPIEKPSELMAKCLEHMEFVVQQIDKLAIDAKTPIDATYDTQFEVDGAQLRTLRVFLDKLDPNREWQGLSKYLTPEGHYLWLCPYHLAQHGKHFEEIP